MSAAAQQAGTIERPDGLSRAQVQSWNNCLAVLRSYALASVITRTRREGVHEDRCYFDCCASAGRIIDGCAGFEKWPLYRNHGATAVRSWREKRGCASMQIVLHFAGTFYLEVDFDLGNPGWDLVSAVRHGWEVAWNFLRGNKTNPFVVAAARGLARV